MENELQNSPRGRTPAIAWSLATILILLGMLVVSALTFICHDKVDNLINPEKNNVEQVCVDTIYTEAVPTIQEVLQFRRHKTLHAHRQCISYNARRCFNRYTKATWNFIV